jgi:hypothetical protein
MIVAAAVNQRQCLAVITRTLTLLVIRVSCSYLLTIEGQRHFYKPQTGDHHQSAQHVTQRNNWKWQTCDGLMRVAVQLHKSDAEA